MTGSETYKALAGCPGFQTEFPMLYNYGTPVKPMTRPLIGREKQLRQLKAGLLRPELCNVLLLGEAGAGKALDDTTLIPVADKRGYVPISELQYGDYVFDENGSPTKVIGVFPQGLKKAYRVTLDDGAEIICNNEHLWNVHDKANKPFETLTLDEMMAQDGELLVPMNGAVQRKARNYQIPPYAIGVILAAGRTRKSGPFCITTCDEFIAKKVSREIGAAEAVRVDNMHHWYFIRTDMRTHSRYLGQQEVLGKLKGDILGENRFIPPNYLLGSIEQRLELLRGLMDAAGAVMNKDDTCDCVFAIQNNERLCKDVQTLVRSLGMRAELLSWKNHNNGVDYTVRIIATVAEKKKIVSLPRYKMRFDNAVETLPKPYPDLKISKIEDLHTEVPMTCIFVEAKSHLFQAGTEHIVTHNTALVQGAMAADQTRVYLEIDISKMIADLRDNNEMATKIKALFDEAAKFVKASDTEIVLFIDEFHLICMLSDAAVEALKPQLADSGTRGVRVIVATTFTEFREYISANQPLVQRLQRIEVLPPSKEATVSILKTFAKKYGVADEVHGTYLYEQIIDLSNRYIPANSQPRKSILLLDLMVGWYRAEPGTKMDINLLYDVLKYSEGIELNVSVDAVGIKKRLDSKVFAQYLATSAVASRLQITSADLNNKTKPMGSFLFTGSTGKLSVRKPCLSRER